MLASADEPRFTWRRPAFASKRRYGSNDSAPGGRAPHRGGRRPPRRRAGSCWGSSRPPTGCAPLGIVYVAADARIGRPAAVHVEKTGVCKQTPLRKQRQRARRSRRTSRRETAALPTVAFLLGAVSPARWLRSPRHRLWSGRCSHRPTSRGSRGEGRRLRANAATEATTARPAVAPHIEAGDGRPARGRVPHRSKVLCFTCGARAPRERSLALRGRFRAQQDPAGAAGGRRGRGQ